MKSTLKFFIVIMMLITLGSIGTVIYLLSHKNIATISTASLKQMYHCPMHPSYISDKPGTCPICAMNLVPINRNEHDRAVETSSSGERKIIYYRDAMKPWFTSEKTWESI